MSVGSLNSSLLAYLSTHWTRFRARLPFLLECFLIILGWLGLCSLLLWKFHLHDPECYLSVSLPITGIKSEAVCRFLLIDYCGAKVNQTRAVLEGMQKSLEKEGIWDYSPNAGIPAPVVSTTPTDGLDPTDSAGVLSTALGNGWSKAFITKTRNQLNCYQVNADHWNKAITTCLWPLDLLGVFGSLIPISLSLSVVLEVCVFHIRILPRLFHRPLGQHSSAALKKFWAAHQTAPAPAPEPSSSRIPTSRELETPPLDIQLTATDREPEGSNSESISAMVPTTQMAAGPPSDHSSSCAIPIVDRDTTGPTISLQVPEELPCGVTAFRSNSAPTASTSAWPSNVLRQRVSPGSSRSQSRNGSTLPGVPEQASRSGSTSPGRTSRDSSTKSSGSVSPWR
ncbi:hypothetical protein EIP91_003466 [Steccherinum ochraceum]|uniref:Uncharacterized protein n=1 Tax=Steccherinum ochraceum TaxID=92696 RepID=A0A4R0RAE3_9APHY|nr:hypothetical protein EIP91_003466 [Steccherinum ochraceum]